MPILEKPITIFNDSKLDKHFNDCFNNTFDTAIKWLDKDNVFVITGDIPAMWLRDSAMQVMPYLHFVDNPKIKKLIKAVLNKQFEQIQIDPYANAFMEDETHKSEWEGMQESDVIPKIVWEKKFELDSLCFPLFLLIKYFEKTSDISVFNDNFYKAFEVILEVVEKERHHSTKSTYFFHRETPWSDRIEEVGRNTNPDEEKGLVWCGFRPSDDACKYNYHIPDNMFLITVLYRLGNIINISLNNKHYSSICFKLVNELKSLVEKYGIKDIPGIGKIYISETDCLANYLTDDDANFPSLLSIPYLEYPFIDETIYQNTRSYILSKKNKYYYEGTLLKGIGSPHTKPNTVWPIAIAVQGLTSNSQSEKDLCLKMLVDSAVDNGLMHESVDVNNPMIYSRSWFSWANSMFAEFVLKCFYK